MKFRTFLLIIAVSISCKPAAEPQADTTRPARPSIPATVSADRRTPIVVVAHNVLPSVVNIQTEATIRRRGTPFDLFFGGPRERTSQSLGSGFIWSQDGIVVTNNHVVEGASRITVNLQDGTQLPARVLGVDPDSDLAVLRIEGKSFSAAPIGTSSDLMIGESVVAVGNPFGLSGTVTTGVVSAIGRSVPSEDTGRTYTDFIQTDASINPGNSGGPLLNIEGRVIGINVAIYAQAQGIGFAIPVDRAKKVIQDLLRYGEVHAAWIGAVTATVTPEESRRRGHTAQRGALVVRVFDGSPADRAGIEPGDIITSVGGRPVDSREAFGTLTSTLATGQTVQVTVDREGAARNVPVRVADPPADLGLRILRQVAGLSIADERRSVVIDEVLRGTRADEIGLQPGDVIVAVNGATVTSSLEANTQLIRGADRSSVVLSVQRGRYVYNLTFPMGV